MEILIGALEGASGVILMVLLARGAVNRLFAPLEALAKDAHRYRWLRSRDLDTISKGGVFVGLVPRNEVLNGEELDAEVDAAMLKS